MIRYILAGLLFAGPAFGQSVTQPQIPPITPGNIVSGGPGGVAGDSTYAPSTMPVTATGSTTARTLAQRAADVVNVKDFGAVGDDTADDTAAINAAIAYVRTLPTPTSAAQGSQQSAKITFPHGTYKVTGNGINATGLRSIGIVFDMEGATIDCQTTGAVCFDALASQFLRFNGLTIVGSSVNEPKIGFQDGRKGTESSDTMYFDRPSITGAFTLAGFYNMASELNTIVQPSFYNSDTSATSHVIVLDGVNYWGVTSAFQTITAPANTAQSFTGLNVLGGSVMLNTLTGGDATVWMSNLTFSNFLGTYIERSSGSHPITIFTTPSWGIAEVYMKVHVETSGITDIFYIDGPVGTANGQLRGFTYVDELPEASNSLFKVSPNVGYVILHDMNIHIDSYLNSGAKVFDNAAIWNVDGTYTQNIGTGNWNAPQTFSGYTNIVGVVNITSSAMTILSDGTAAKALGPANTPMWLGPVSNTNKSPIDILGPITANGGITLGNGGFDSWVTIPKAAAAATAPGAGALKLQTLAGTNAGTCKIVAYAGTSTTPTTVIDNVGSGC